MNKRFWDLFGNDYKRNCLDWIHYEKNPVIPPEGSLWKSRWTANPDFLEYKGKQLLYYRGDGLMPGNTEHYHDRIAVAEVVRAEPGIFEFKDLNDGMPVIDIGEEGEFDSGHCLDPAAVVFKDKIYLYYSAIGPGFDSVGLAVSSDGINFNKLGKVMDGRGPDAIVHEGRMYLLYQKMRKDHFELYLSVSSDGINFKSIQEAPIFLGEKRSWDSYSITTPRISFSDGWFYLFYGGSSYMSDEPDYFGLARSMDLINWERHPGNPVFGCGPKGSEDGGAIWFPALLETEDSFIMIYEGSRGKYSWDLSSSICMSWIYK